MTRERVVHLAFFVAAFGSIALLLGHVHGIARMSVSGLAVGVPATLVALACAVVAYRSGDEEFRDRFVAGAIGGLLGTVGYDLVRIPLHYAGFNPFPPIRGYGVWLLGVGSSSPGSDAVGFVYHLSNGVTFGWIYAFVALRRHWAWAVLWGLLLETLAVVSAFGEVFALRSAYATLTIAYGAHVAYGLPLGWVCQEPERLRRFLPLHRRAAGLMTVWAVLLTTGWFATAWQPFSCDPPVGTIRVGPEALCPGWTDLPVGAELELDNALDAEVVLRYRAPGGLQGDGTELRIPAGATGTLPIGQPGLYQILTPARPWRSVLVSAHRQDDYRPR